MAGTSKSYNLPFDYVLHEMSYANVLMYSSVLPTYDFDKDKEKNNEVINADDPKNNDMITKIINGEIF